MSSKRWLAPWKDSAEKPAIYHCLSRVVDRRFVYGDEDFTEFEIKHSGCFRDRAARPEGRTTPPTDPDERN